MITHFKLSFLYFSNVYFFSHLILKCGILILHRNKVFFFFFLNIQPNYCSTSVGNPSANVNMPVSERVPRTVTGTFITASSSLAGLVLYLRTGSKTNISYY